MSLITHYNINLTFTRVRLRRRTEIKKKMNNNNNNDDDDNNNDDDDNNNNDDDDNNNEDDDDNNKDDDDDDDDDDLFIDAVLSRFEWQNLPYDTLCLSFSYNLIGYFKQALKSDWLFCF